MKLTKILALTVAALLAVLCLASCVGTNGTGVNYAENNTEFVIGATGPLTGDASSYGVSVQKGASLAVEELNAAGGLNGVNFKFDMKDDKAAAADAATGYDILYESGMNISLGSVTSGSCASFAAKAEADNVFFITPSASAANCIDASCGFRVCFGDPDQGVLAAQQLKEDGFEKIGAIYDTSDPYSAGIYEAFKAEMANLSIEYIEQTFDAENKKDFSTQLEALKDCDVIFCPFYYTEGGLVAKAAVAKGCDALLFGCDGFDGIADQIDDTVTNTIKYITPFDVNSDKEPTKSFVTAYEAKYGETPDQFAADGYDAVMVIYETMKKAGVSDPTIAPSELCDIVIATITAEDFVFTGATGEMTWDKSGAPTKVPVIVDLN